MIRVAIALAIIQTICAAQTLPAVSKDSLDNGVLPLHSHFSLGVFPAWTFNQYKANFFALDGIYCGSFSSGSGNGPGAGITAEYGLGKFAVAGLRASFLNEGGTFTYPLPDFPYRDTTTGATFNVAHDHLFVATIYSLFFAAVMKLYPILPLNRLFVTLGGTVSIPIVNTFDQRERITNTDKYVFRDGTSDHSLLTGTIPGSAARLGAIGGIGYDIMLSRQFSVSPELDYDFPLTKTDGELDWKTSMLETTATIRYTFLPPPPAPPPAPIATPKPIVQAPKPTIPPPPAPTPTVLKVAVSAFAPNGKVPPPIIVEEVNVRESFPILNYIFFDSLGAAIPNRYALLDSNGARTFNERTLPPSTLGVYHNILNIIGKRLAEDPHARLTITGCIDPYSENRPLAMRRAATVKNYFVNTWGISPHRLRLSSRGSPSRQSNPAYPEGRDENRRVELGSTDNDSIFAPVVVVESARQSTLADHTDSSYIDFAPAVVSSAGIRRWKLSVGSGSNVIRTYGGTDSIPGVIKWDLKDSHGQPPAVQGKLFYSLSATDAVGQTSVTPPQSLDIDQRLLTRERAEQVVEQHTIEKFSLIVFDYDLKNISSANKRVAENIAQRIQPESQVTVIGYTDKLGGDEYDKELSEGRARNVAAILQRYSRIADSNIVARGEGKTEMFPNDTPEGRFFCRTVQVIINTRADHHELKKEQ